MIAGYFLGARPASLAHNISYWRSYIPTFGPLGAPGAHRFTFSWGLMQFLHSLKCKVFVMLARMLIQRAGLFPRCHDHFVRNATRLRIPTAQRIPLLRRRYPATDNVSNHPLTPGLNMDSSWPCLLSTSPQTILRQSKGSFTIIDSYESVHSIRFLMTPLPLPKSVL